MLDVKLHARRAVSALTPSKLIELGSDLSKDAQIQMPSGFRDVGHTNRQKTQHFGLNGPSDEIVTETTQGMPPLWTILRAMTLEQAGSPCSPTMRCRIESIARHLVPASHGEKRRLLAKRGKHRVLPVRRPSRNCVKLTLQFSGHGVVGFPVRCLLFGTPDKRDLFEGNPFEMVTKFANGYRDIIVADNQSERDALRPGTLTLDLASSALFSVLCHFGKERRPLDVTCDEHPQLEKISETLIGGDNDPGIVRARRLNPQADISWTLARKVRFDESRNRPGLQVADLIAGAASTLASGRSAKRGMEAHLELVDRHINPHTMLPDFDAVRPKDRGPMVNWTILYGLGERASRGEDPYLLLRELYAEAERRWDAGEMPLATE